MSLNARSFLRSVGSVLLLTMIAGSGCDSGATNASNTPVEPVPIRPKPAEAPLASLSPEARELERKRQAWAKVALYDPSKATLRAAGLFKVKMETSLGDVILEVQREYAPMSVDRFYNLVLMGFYDECRFHRVIAGGFVEFGIHPDPQVSEKWKDAAFDADELLVRNRRKSMSFSVDNNRIRNTRVLINTNANFKLDDFKFIPFATVIEGMENVDDLFADYGEAPPAGQGPDRDILHERGNVYLDENFPGLDIIVKMTIFEASLDPEFPDWVE